jgi:diaminopimelate decarboxylase
MSRPARFAPLGKTIPAALRHAIKEAALPTTEQQFGFMAEEGSLSKRPVGLFYDLDAWQRNLESCRDAFGSGFLHAIAVKSNPLTEMMVRARDLGFGAETASIGEALHVQSLGQEGNQIIFDSPAKTVAEIRYALVHGMHLNIDNFEELDVVARVIESLPRGSSTSDIGLRINPLVGAGNIAALSVSTADSKFGIAESRKSEMLAAFAKYPWLNTVHVHVGSGDMGVKILTDGVAVAVEFAEEVNRHLGKKQVVVLDMGGGMAVNYGSEDWHTEQAPSFHAYAESLRARVPQLFPGNPASPFRKVITEFGQSLNAKAGWLASRVEYMKPIPDGHVAVIHFGAETCLRQAYTGQHKRRVEFFDGNTCLQKPDTPDIPGTKVHVAGPLCFQGDFLTKDANVEGLRRDDFVVMREAGSNCLSLFSRHCSRQAPPVYGYKADEKGEIKEWHLLKPIESFESISTFWGSSATKRQRIEDQ